MKVPRKWARKQVRRALRESGSALAKRKRQEEKRQSRVARRRGD